ncbi:ST3GAL2 [Cervus elaphus hippelaphus]|uniref:ST3GAL2 n=1 Tax=Cervus elaphus hippelaphus TaxID=46360 RepID=A0A212DBU0_CEREH|nr:ST3GAL2 [Cervus elaphus hippelaphus]
MKCSLRVWFLSMAFLLVFVMSLLFTYSHHSTATLPYLDSGALDGAPRVELSWFPSAGQQMDLQLLK